MSNVAVRPAPASNAVTAFVRRHPVACYVAIAFAISWGGVLAVVRGGAIPAPPSEASRLFTLVYLAMLAGPSVAGLTLTFVTGGAAGLHRYRERLGKWRVAPSSYVTALLAAPLALVLTALALWPVSTHFAPALLGSGMIEPAGPVQADNVTMLLLLAACVGIGAGFFEELGWTGFAVPTLLERRGVVWTGLVVGVIWGAWHFFAIWWGSASAFGSVPIPLYLLVALFSFLPPYRVLMVRVYERTGSLPAAILMHASLTTSMIIFGPPINGWESVIYDLTFGAVLWAIVLVTVRRERLPSVRDPVAHPSQPVTPTRSRA